MVGALWHADIMLNQLTKSSRDLPLLIEKAKVLYKKFDSSARYLWKNHKTLSGVVDSIRGGYSHLHMADALARYGVLFMENWDDANGRCDVTLADVEAAKEYSAKLVVALDGPNNARTAEYRILRNRAGERLKQMVNDIRAAAAFIYRNTPAEMKRYPSLYTRSTRRSKSSKMEKTPNALISPIEPVPTEPANKIISHENALNA